MITFKKKIDDKNIKIYNFQEKGKSGKYAYTIKKDNRKVDAYLSAGTVNDEDEFSQSLFSRRSEKYHCTGKDISI